MRDARRGRFDMVLTWACDRIARSTKHLLEVLDEFNRLNIEFVRFRESIDTAGRSAGLSSSSSVPSLNRTQLDRRKSEGRHASSPSRRTSRRTLPLNYRSGSDRLRAKSGLQHQDDRQKPPHLNRNCPARAEGPGSSSKTGPATSLYRCDKTGRKRSRLNPLKSMAGSPRSGRVKR